MISKEEEKEFDLLVTSARENETFNEDNTSSIPVQPNSKPKLLKKNSVYLESQQHC